VPLTLGQELGAPLALAPDKRSPLKIGRVLGAEEGPLPTLSRVLGEEFGLLLTLGPVLGSVLLLLLSRALGDLIRHYDTSTIVHNVTMDEELAVAY
jgi:hypothetical protein